MTRRLALLALLLPLAACDSGDDDATADRPDALVGTWGLDAIERRVELTSPTSQTVVLLDAVAPATLTASDADLPELRFAQLSSFGSSVEYSFTSYDPEGNRPEEYAELSVSQNDLGFYNARLRVFDGIQTRSSFADGDTPVVSRTAGRVTLSRLTLNGSAGSVAIQGSATFPTEALAAGVPTPVTVSRTVIEPGPLGVSPTRYTFGEFGDWRAEFDFTSSETDVRFGTWAANDSRLRIETRRDEDFGTIQRFDYTLERDTLGLGLVIQDCERDADCLEFYTDQYGLTTRLSAVRELNVQQFVPAEAPFKTAPTAVAAPADARGAAWPWTAEASR